MAEIKLKRAYEEPSAEDGERILVERLWPRGLRKEDARLTAWMRDIAPSPALRTWYGHAPAKWEEFRARYRRELESDERKALLAELADKARRGPLTLVYAARDTEHNSALLVKEAVEGLL